MKRNNLTFLNVSEFFHYVFILQLSNWNFFSPVVYFNLTVSISFVNKKMLTKHRYSLMLSLEIFGLWIFTAC